MGVVPLSNNIQPIECWRLDLCCRLVEVENVWVSVGDLKQDGVLWRRQEYLGSADYSATTTMPSTVTVPEGGRGWRKFSNYNRANLGSAQDTHCSKAVRMSPS